MRILLADDHPLFRQGLRSLLDTLPDLEVVGEARTGEQAIMLAQTVQPDLVIMDIQMPDMNGIDATRRLIQTMPHLAILIVTMFEDDASLFAAMRAGARGYVIKDAEPDDMLRAIAAVGQGEAIFSPAIAARVLSMFSSPTEATAKALFPTLTERERQILRLLAHSTTNAEIAQTLGVTTKTVANYVSTILSKLQVVDRAQAILRAREAGL
ncbi:MAG TPA: response regulator transcription factor [Ktedonobacterales bacterium]